VQVADWEASDSERLRYPVRMRISLLLLAVVLSACNDEASKAPLAPGGGGPRSVEETPRDSGANVDDMDAGSTPDGGAGPLPLECTRIEPVMITSDEVPTGTATTTPLDFKVTRQVATWSGDCPSPSLVIELSNGICPTGQGHELVFWFPASSIADGKIGLGLNEIDPDAVSAAGIRVRYTRPVRYAPIGEYGTCDGSFGTISFYDAPDVSRPMNLRASYELNLTACDDTRNPTQVVAGYFDVWVRRDLAGVCPP
jgi:hypothetical protein